MSLPRSGRRLAAVLSRPLSSSLRNAGGALTAISEAVSERRALTDSLVAEDVGDGGLRSLSDEQCRALLRSTSIGRLAYVARAGVPDIVPVNFLFDGHDVLIRSGPGPKLQAAERGDLVAFEVDDLDPATRAGRSVVVHGRAMRLGAGDRSSSAQPSPWANGPRHHVIRIRPQRITGRRIG